MAITSEKLETGTAAAKVAKRARRMTGAQRREHLIKAATCIFSQKGFSGSTTKEIAAKAKVNEALIFRHFGDKDCLFKAVIAAKFTRIKESDLSIQMKDAAEKRNDEAVFFLAARLVLERYRSEQDVLRILIYGILEHRTYIVERFEQELSPLKTFLIGYIEERAADKVFFADNPELAVFGFIGMVTHHATLGELLGEDRQPAANDEALRFYTKTILAVLKKDHNSRG